ncbi:MAG: radical SAM protein, partial [Candidatus Thorarchaeota archaeon]
MSVSKRFVRDIEGDSLIVGQLPLGCKLCANGSKMVLFVTGLCSSACYYCPLSQDKSGLDVVFADEMPVRDDSDVLFEAKAINGDGAGISGGDPLCNLDRTLKFIRLLKKEYGSTFHIHLYTSQTNVIYEVLKKLKEAGLDEIRFHPQTSDWSGVQQAIDLGMVVGLEVPSIPGKQEELKQTAKRAEEIGVSFLNINELEASETNFEKLVSMGMRLTNMESASIEGSASTAREVLEWSVDNLQKLSVHFCSARFKDAVQMRRRLERRLEETIRNFEERYEYDPLVILGVIRAVHGKKLEHEQLVLIHSVLQSHFDVPSDLMNIDETRNRVEMAPWVLEEISDKLKEKLASIEEIEMGIA